MVGDGGINNPWQANITMNAVADAAYAKCVGQLARDLFGVESAVRKRKDSQALIVCISSTSLVEFLTSKGLVRGNKLKGGVRIPGWILNKRAYRIACVRGLMDTDGCLFIHKHQILGKTYRNIGLCFSNHASAVLGQVAQIFEEFGIIPHISKDGRKLYLYSQEAVEKYLAVFGTSNERISSVYRKWRRG